MPSAASPSSAESFLEEDRDVDEVPTCEDDTMEGFDPMYMNLPPAGLVCAIGGGLSFFKNSGHESGNGSCFCFLQ